MLGECLLTPGFRNSVLASNLLSKHSGGKK
jgi:hypothetical protein